MFNPNENPNLSTGNNAESTPNSEGENTMSENNQDFTDDPQFLKDIDSMKVTFHSEKESKKGTPDEILAGNYLARITDVYQKNHSSGSYFMIIVNMVVVDGDFSDFPLTKFYHLKSQPALDFFKKEMKLIGHSVTSENDLPILLNNLPETLVMTNVVFNDNGNRIIYLKSASTPKKVVNAIPKLKW